MLLQRWSLEIENLVEEVLVSLNPIQHTTPATAKLCASKVAPFRVVRLGKFLAIPIMRRPKPVTLTHTHCFRQGIRTEKWEISILGPVSLSTTKVGKAILHWKYTPWRPRNSMTERTKPISSAVSPDHHQKYTQCFWASALLGNITPYPFSACRFEKWFGKKRLDIENLQETQCAFSKMRNVVAPQLSSTSAQKHWVQ